MPDTQHVTVNAYHPYPAFYWEFKLTGGVAADIEGYDAYQSGQHTKTVGINATIDEVGSIRCTIGPLSAGVPTPGAEGTITTDWIPVSVGALTWDVNPGPKDVTIQTSMPDTVYADLSLRAGSIDEEYYFDPAGRAECAGTFKLEAIVDGKVPIGGTYGATADAVFDYGMVVPSAVVDNACWVRQFNYANLPTNRVNLDWFELAEDGSSDIAAFINGSIRPVFQDELFLKVPSVYDCRCSGIELRGKASDETYDQTVARTGLKWVKGFYLESGGNNKVIWRANNEYYAEGMGDNPARIGVYASGQTEAGLRSRCMFYAVGAAESNLTYPDGYPWTVCETESGIRLQGILPPITAYVESDPGRRASPYGAILLNNATPENTVFTFRHDVYDWPWWGLKILSSHQRATTNVTGTYQTHGVQLNSQAEINHDPNLGGLVIRDIYCYGAPLTNTENSTSEEADARDEEWSPFTHAEYPVNGQLTGSLTTEFGASNWFANQGYGFGTSAQDPFVITQKNWCELEADEPPRPQYNYRISKRLQGGKIDVLKELGENTWPRYLTVDNTDSQENWQYGTNLECTDGTDKIEGLTLRVINEDGRQASLIGDYGGGVAGTDAYVRDCTFYGSTNAWKAQVANCTFGAPGDLMTFVTRLKLDWTVGSKSDEDFQRPDNNTLHIKAPLVEITGALNQDFDGCDFSGGDPEGNIIEIGTTNGSGERSMHRPTTATFTNCIFPAAGYIAVVGNWTGVGGYPDPGNPADVLITIKRDGKPDVVIPSAEHSFPFNVSQLNDPPETYYPDSLVLEFDIPEGDLAISIPTQGAGTNVYARWGEPDEAGDGVVSGTNLLHTYAAAGRYIVELSRNVADLPGGTLGGVRWYNNTADSPKLVDVVQWGGVNLQSASYRQCTTLSAISAQDLPGVYRLGSAFRSCSSLTAIPKVTDWDISADDDAVYAFSGTAFASIDLSNWTGVETLDNTSNMFNSCTSLVSADFTGWDFTPTTMERMFIACFSLTGSVDISHFKVADLNATGLRDMFDQTPWNSTDYKAALNSWAAQETIPSGLEWHAGTATSAAGGGEAARDTLVNTYGWTIIDGDDTWSTAAAANANGEGLS